MNLFGVALVVGLSYGAIKLFQQGEYLPAWMCLAVVLFALGAGGGL